MARFILVHGAWHGGWCWDRVISALRSAGHEAVAPDLPGHGSDPTPTADVTFEGGVNRIVAELNAGEPAILVGHSLGGIYVSAAAEAAPHQVLRLVYLCAFVPGDGDTANSGGRLNLATALHPANMETLDGGVAVRLKDRFIRPAFYHDVPDAEADAAKARLVPQATSVMGSKVSLSEANFGSIPKSYIECLEDQALHLVAQRTMYTAAGIDDVVTLDTGHSPFLSAPGALAEILDTWA